MTDSELDRLVRELEDVATRLRTGDLDAAEAASVVENCARLAVSIGGELEALGRRADDPDQEQLL